MLTSNAFEFVPDDLERVGIHAFLTNSYHISLLYSLPSLSWVACVHSDFFTHTHKKTQSKIEIEMHIEFGMVSLTSIQLFPLFVQIEPNNLK